MAIQNLSDIQWQGRFSHKKALLFDSEDFDSRGTKMQVIKFTKGTKIEPHFHRVRTEAFLVLVGNGQIQIGDEILLSTKHDFLLCKPGTIHAFNNDEEEDFIIAVFRTNDPGDSDMIWLNDTNITRV